MGMHPDQVTVSKELARSLVEKQFPEWADLPVEPAPSDGTDHAIFRLGQEFAIRAPLRASAAAQVDKEQVWLPRIAAYLPVPVPTPVAAGQPADGYPFCWSICRWLKGHNPPVELAESMRLGAALGDFVSTLHRLDTAGGPHPGKHNFGRGAPITLRDEPTRKAILQLADVIDGRAAAAAWDRDMRAEAPWIPVWIHGDLCPGNVLVDGSRVSAVLDFGGLAVGDPACDLIIAWNFLHGAGRAAFREAVAGDDMTWQRGRAWALSIALIQLPYYSESNPGLAANARLTIERILSDGG